MKSKVVLSYLRRRLRWRPTCCAVAGGLTLLSAQPLHAQQNVQIIPIHPKLYAGAGFTGSYTNNQIRMVVSGGSDPVNVSFGGVPTGATVALLPPFDTNNFVGTVTPQYGVTVGPSLAKGAYSITITASNTVTTATTNSTFTLLAGQLFKGTGVDTNWNNTANWTTAALPGADDDVMFQDTSDNTNLLTGSLTIGSLTYIRNLSGTNHNTILSPGVTLTVAGTNGFRANVDSLVGANKTTTINIIGTNASLVVSNTSASFSVASLNTGGSGTAINMSGLDRFTAIVDRVGFGDVTLTNGGASGAQILGTCFLAKTNIIKATMAAGDMTGDNVTTAITFFNNAENFNNGSASTINLGSSNVIQANSIRISAARVGSGNNIVRLPTTGGPTNVAYLRSASGGRIPLFAVAFDSGLANSGNNSQGQFDMRNGTVDLQADSIWLGRFRSNSAPSGASARGTIHMQFGTIDANNVVLGYQAFTNEAFVNGTLNIMGSGSFIVNNELHLGWTTGATNLANIAGSFGRVNVSSNGTLRAREIRAGGTAKANLNQNRIVLSHGGRLILTNTLGAADAWVDLLAMTNNSSLTLHGLTAGATNLFVGTFTTTLGGGTINRIHVPALNGVSSYPVSIPFLSYTNLADTSQLGFGTLPSGIFGESITNDAVNKLVWITFTTNAPKVLVWRGNTDNNWDTFTTNWVTQVGTIPTKFTDGDSVVFDDTATGLTTINIPGSVVPGQTAATSGIVVSNNTFNYTFNSGEIAGNATLQKEGSRDLTVHATVSPTITMNGGALLGNGTVGGVTAGPGTFMTAFAGTVSGTLDVSNATVSVSGTVSNGLVLRAGAMTNNGTIYGPVNLQPGIYLTNGNTMNVIVPWVVPTNGTLVNNGMIVQSGTVGGNGGLTVQSNATLMGTGTITIPGDGSTVKADGRVTIGAGGRLVIGNSPNEIATVKIATRLDLNAGSTTVFDVDTSSTNDVILLREPSVALGHVNFGVGSQPGGTLLINKLGGPAFTPASTLTLFDRNGNVNEPENLNPAVPMVTPQPLPGYVWDVSQTVTNLIIAVTTPPLMTNSIVLGTNGVTSFEFSWPASYRGWRLERQTNTLSVGLALEATNWTQVFYSSAGTNILYYPGATNDYSTYYFRTVQALTTTNGESLYPCVFYRLVYP